MLFCHGVHIVQCIWTVFTGQILHPHSQNLLEQFSCFKLLRLWIFFFLAFFFFLTAFSAVQAMRSASWSRRIVKRLYPILFYCFLRTLRSRPCSMPIQGEMYIHINILPKILLSVHVVAFFIKFVLLNLLY